MTWNLPDVYGLFDILAYIFKKDGMYRMWIGNLPYVVLFEPNSIEALLSSNQHIDKSGDYDHLHPWLGTGLLTRYTDVMYFFFLYI